MSENTFGEWVKKSASLVTTEKYSINVGPSFVGAWVVGGWTQFYVYERPTDEQIKNTEALLGWKWKEFK